METVGVPNEVVQRLRLLEERDGELRESAVVVEAEAADSPLHGYFEWDDSEAARLHRLSQAGALIRRVKVQIIREPDSPPIRARAFIARRDLNEDDKAAAGSYLSLDRVAGDSVRESSLREQMERDVRRLQRKYRDMETFLQVLRDVVGPEAA